MEYMAKKPPGKHPSAGAHGGGVRGDQVNRGSRTFEGRFGRMFRALPAAEFSITALTKLGEEMSAKPEQQDIPTSITDPKEKQPIAPEEKKYPGTILQPLMNCIITFAVVGFLTLASDSKAQQAPRLPPEPRPMPPAPARPETPLSIDNLGNISGKFILRDGEVLFYPSNITTVTASAPFSVPPTNSLVRLDPKLRDLVAKQTQLISSLSSSIQELQRAVEEMRTSSQEETTQLKKQLVLTDTRLKMLETKTGGN